MKMFVDYMHIEIPRRAHLTKGFLEKVPREFRGIIFDQKKIGLFVKFEAEGYWWKLTFKGRSGKRLIFTLGYDLLPRDARDLTHDFFRMYQEDAREQCSCGRFIVTDLTHHLARPRSVCATCEFEFRARRIRRTRDSKLRAAIALLGRENLARWEAQRTA
jgi:hypothetical protein